MLRGIYIAGSGMLAEAMRQEIVANNLANATTAGYKRTDAATSPFMSALVRNMAMPGQPAVGTMNFGSAVTRMDVVNAQGAIRNTGNQLDFALMGDGWFTIRTQGGMRYTRDGGFTLSTDGTLTTKAGDPVMGVDGPIKFSPNLPIGVQTDGSITQDNRIVARMRITALQDGTIAKEGENLVNGTTRGAGTAVVRQSYLEGSTVNPVSEMVELIRVMRSFEANQKAVQAQDETLAQAVSKVGVV